MNCHRNMLLLLLLFCMMSMALYAQVPRANTDPSFDRDVVYLMCPDTDPGGGGSEPQPELPDPTDTSPILIDLLGDGFVLGGPESAVFFDLWGIGEPIYIQWVAGSDDVFLAKDINNNGIVDDGSELFGNGTRLMLENGAFAPNGFVGLSQYDDPRLGGNDDGLISAEDSVWEELFLWQDANFDGVSTANELLTLDDVALHWIETVPTEQKMYDGYGNWLRFWSEAQNWSLMPLTVVDVYFKKLPWPMRRSKNRIGLGGGDK